jgi:hypothetical protein
MTKRKRRILWEHAKGITSVLLQLAGVAGIVWAIWLREPSPIVIPPTSRLDVHQGRITEIVLGDK